MPARPCAAPRPQRGRASLRDRHPPSVSPKRFPDFLPSSSSSPRPGRTSLGTPAAARGAVSGPPAPAAPLALGRCHCPALFICQAPRRPLAAASPSPSPRPPEARSRPGGGRCPAGGERPRAAAPYLPRPLPRRPGRCPSPPRRSPAPRRSPRRPRPRRPGRCYSGSPRPRVGPAAPLPPPASPCPG